MVDESWEYKKAFEAYLRYGTPLELSLKKAKNKGNQKRTTSHYIWRTRGDGKVRDSHQENNGKIFAWDNPPPTGHPGEDYGCRCKAEPYTPQEAEYFHINLHNVSDNGKEWTHRDFIWHYFYGNGRFIRVRDIGHLRKIVAEFRRIVIDLPHKLPGQIADAARNTNSADFKGFFRKPYPFRDIVYSFGHSVIEGRFNGRMKNNHGLLELTGQISFELSDKFRDPLELEETAKNIKETRQKLKQLIDKYIIAAINKGITKVQDIVSYVINKLSFITEYLEYIDRELRKYIHDRVLETLSHNSNKSASAFFTKAYPDLPGSTPYDMVDQWSGSFTAKVLLDKSKSIYVHEDNR